MAVERGARPRRLAAPVEVDPRSFAAVLRRHRVRAGVSQNELARRAGIDAAYISRLERNLHDLAGGGPRRGVVLSMAQALDLDGSSTDRLLFSAGLAPSVDYQALAERYGELLAGVRALIGTGSMTTTTTTTTVTTIVELEG